MLPPPHALFSPHRLSVHPIMQKRQKKLPSKNLVHSGANDWELNAKPVTFQQDITNGLGPEAPKATSRGSVVQHGLTPGQRGFFTPINHRSCHHKHIW